MPQSDVRSLWDALSASGNLFSRKLWGASASVTLGDLITGTSLSQRPEEFRGRSVLLAAEDQLTAALGLIELDGIARRIVLLPPGLAPAHIALVMETGAVDVVVSDEASVVSGDPKPGRTVTCRPQLTPTESERSWRHQTEWILLTSGTTGAPKMVVHTLSTLTGAIKNIRHQGRPVVWSTFYDIRRYGGLQILLRALLNGGSLVLSGGNEPLGDFITRASAHGVTHISGTPSHWRRALMSPSARKLAPRYVRLSGEIADQAILDNLRAVYQGAKVVHAFASTEGGLAFEVGDGRAGFPSSLIDTRDGGVELKVQDGSLRIRSARTAHRYLGNTIENLADADGFVDTRDLVEPRGDRYYFAGRRDGVINVGGQKVHPEEIETVINRHPSVQMSLVKARRSPITGAVVVAHVVVKSDSAGPGVPIGAEALKGEILEACRLALAPYKVPATVRLVPSLEITATGKLVRSDA